MSYKSTFRQLVKKEPASIYPFYLHTSNTKIRDLVFETLIDRDVSDLSLKPLLAKKWKVFKKEKAVLFYLRDDVTFHDGSKMTAEDVKFSFDILFEKKYETMGWTPAFSNFTKAQVVSPYEIKFYYKREKFENLESFSFLIVLPKKIYSKRSKSKTFNQVALGSGPYTFREWKKNKSITLEKNSNWWGNRVYKNQHLFKKHIIKFAPDASLAISMIEQGAVDFVEFFRISDAKKMKGPLWRSEVKKVAVELKFPTNISYIAWNLSDPLFKDKKVRQALAHMIDKDLIISKFYKGEALKATGPLLVTGTHHPKGFKGLEFDLKKARQLLKEAFVLQLSVWLQIQLQPCCKKKNFKPFGVLENNKHHPAFKLLLAQQIPQIHQLYWLHQPRERPKDFFPFGVGTKYWSPMQN